MNRDVLQYFVMVKHTQHTACFTEDRTEKASARNPFDLPLPRYKMKRGNVISSLLLPQPMAVCTSLWIIADKVLCSPAVEPLLSPASVTSHHSKLTRGLHGWRAHTFLVSYLSLLGAVLGGKQSKPIGSHWANFYTRVPSDVAAAYTTHRFSCSHFPFHFLHNGWQQYS